MKSVASSFVIVFLTSCGMETSCDIKEELTSPDGKFVATAFVLDSGATTSWSPQVDLRPANQLFQARGNVFAGYGSPNIHIEWLSPSRLVVQVDPTCEVTLFKANHEGVTIETKQTK
jgi:hypothetical protein